MASPSSSIAAILVSTGLFLMGNGLIGTLTPLRAHLDGFSDIAVGTLGTWYFAGFVLGCFTGPPLLSRVGHIRAFAVAAALVAMSVLILPIWVTPLAWFAARGITGFSLAILYMAIESWLNDRASNETRGQILSLYVAVNLSALLLGQWLLLLGEPQSFELFSIGAMLYCLCLMPMGLTRLPPPALRPALHIDLARILPMARSGRWHRFTASRSASRCARSHSS
jgi:MFS family permease